MSLSYYNYYNQTRITRPSRVVSGQGMYARNSRGLMAALLVFALFVGLAALLPVMKKPEIVLVLAAGLVAVLGIIRWPILGTYIVVILPILFDGFPSAFVSTPISEMGVFRNLSYRGLPEFVYISLFELVVALTLASALMRRFNAHKKLERGPLYRPLMAFGAMVVLGELNGLTTGGDFKITLWEIRPLLYVVLLYILAVNTISKPAQLRIILWLTALTTAARCLEGIYRYFKMPADVRSVAPVILEHDDSLFLVVAVALLVAAALWRKWLPKRFYPALWALLPFALYMMVINGRRAVFLCVFIMLAAFVPLLWASMRSKEQRRRFVYGLVIAIIAGVAYMGAFFNKEGGIAQPAAAVRSMFVPSERDYLSNLYRDQENANLRYTIDSSPVIGIGFGKPFKVIVPMVDLTKDWAFQFYMPHNNMLWLWMRMGIIGFVAFWVAIGAAVILVTACLRLGVARLRLLADQERAEALALKATQPDRARALSSRTLGLYRVRFRVPDNTRGLQVSVGDTARRSTHREMRECAEFLVLAMLVLATLVSLAGLGVVDQGLMSFRLSAFAGMALGALSAAWNMYSIKYRVPAEMKLDKLPEQEGIFGAQRRRIRALVGA
jgi:O-antigen ligase